MRRFHLHSALKRLQKYWDIPLPLSILHHSSNFLEACNLTKNSRAFAQALRSFEERFRSLRHSHIVITTSAVETASGSTFCAAHLGEVLATLTALIRNNFEGKITLDLNEELDKVGTISASLTSKLGWHDAALRKSYLLEIDKAVRILRGRGLTVETNSEPQLLTPVRHRNELLNAHELPELSPKTAYTLEHYSTDTPRFVGFDARYPDQISYSFNSRGYRNDFEHDVQQPHSVALGCSFVEGVGVAYENSLTPQLARLEGRPVLCLACHGGSISFMYRSFLNYLAQNPVKPTNLYAIFTEVQRIEAVDTYIHENGVFSTFSAWSRPRLMEYLAGVGVGFAYISAYLTYVFLKEYCSREGIKLRAVFYNYWNPSPEFYNNLYGENVQSQLWGRQFVDYGRDRLHPGTRELARLARRLYNDL